MTFLFDRLLVMIDQPFLMRMLELSEQQGPISQDEICSCKIGGPLDYAKINFDDYMAMSKDACKFLDMGYFRWVGFGRMEITIKGTMLLIMLRHGIKMDGYTFLDNYTFNHR